ncbi:MAG: thiamine pyrophosphate-dependent enzyme [Candidatus Korobacteraceae bacterium]|jgi:thiamine pyrophosphate-dependent acetolactate synthase large subunit-like protein
MNVASMLVSRLAENGVTHVFGVAGDALNPFTDAIRRDGRIRWVGVHHEENAAYAAYAQSAIRGGPSVCAGTVGPGSLHLLNGLYDAKREGFSSVIAITGQLPHGERETKFFQAVDLKRIFGDVCAFQAVIAEPEQMPRIAEIALQIAIARQEVVRIELPADVLPKTVPSQRFMHPLVKTVSPMVPLISEISKAADLINNSKRATFFCGIGCRDAHGEILEMAKRIGAPIAHTLRAKEIFDADQGQSVGMTGLIGAPSGYHAVLDCDVLVMLGTNFPYDEFLPADIPIIQVDREVENIGSRAPVSLGIVGDVKETLRLLTPLLEQRPSGRWLSSLLSLHDKWLAHNLHQSDPSLDRSPILPPVVARIVSDRASDDAIFVVDGGSATVYMARYMQLHGGRRVLSSFNHGAISGGFGMAMGASCANPKRQVWLLTGDGAFGMMPQDVITAKDFGWPVKIVVFDNQEFDFVRMEMEVAGLPVDPAATRVRNMDFTAFAKANGIGSAVAERPSEMIAAVEQALAYDGPFLIDAKVQSGLLSMPPHIQPSQALGFGISKIKEAVLGLAGDHEQWINFENEFRANLAG